MTPTTLPTALLGGALAADGETAVRSVLSRLETKREEIIATLTRLRSEGLEIDRVAEPMDASVALQAREQRAGEIQRANATLLSVNWAIARWGLSLGTTCCRCEGEISAKRLAALPWAARCASCQEAADGGLD